MKEQNLLYEHQPLNNRRRQRPFLRFLVWLLAAVLFIALGLGAYSFFWAKKIEHQVQFRPKTARRIQRVVKPPRQNEPIDILLAGVDRRKGQKFGRADTIALLRIDPADKSAYLLSIPRDSRVKIKGRGRDKINHAWAFGGAPLLINSVTDFLGLPVNYYFEVDFVGFEKVVNAVGGVDFSIDRGWYDGELDVRVRQCTHRRLGKEALALVRARHQFAGGDYDRIKNQQRFLIAVMKQSLGSYSQVPRLAEIMADDSRTNMDLTTMIKLGRAFSGAQDNLQVTTLPGRGRTIGGIWYFIPDETAKRDLVATMKAKGPWEIKPAGAASN